MIVQDWPTCEATTKAMKISTLGSSVRKASSLFLFHPQNQIQK
jgi:hypothetical protein